MNNYYLNASLIFLVLVFISIAGCTTPQVKSPPPDFTPTCIQGTVWYRTPVGSISVPYSGVDLTAFKSGTEQPLAETKADEAGSYCIEVPLGEVKVDLRVWGLALVRGISYSCKGSVTDFDLETTAKECGADCKKADILAECHEFNPRKRNR